MSNSLTITEKEHWKARIEKRIQKQIDALCVEVPGFMEEIRKTARDRAVHSLGIAKLQQRLEKIGRQQQHLEEEESVLRGQIIAKLQGVPVAQVGRPYGFDADVSEAIEKQQRIHEDELLSETPRGREILDLQMEMENLLDTVWLATSPRQIKELWEKVDEMLGDRGSAPQRKALAIESSEDEG